MADFPALEPLDRSYGLGEHMVSAVESQNGDLTPFIHSTSPSGIPISLRFPALTLSQAQQIRDHYSGQRGGVRDFAIPAQVWRMHSSLYDVWPSGTTFTYAAPPTEAPRSGELFDVDVSLLSF
jgi:hypothetical protein